MVRTYVSFESDFHDDGEWDDGGNVVSPPGLAITKFVRDSFNSESIKAGEPENYEDFGWEFGCSVGRARVWVLLQFAEPWLIIVHLQSWIFNLMRGGSGTDALQQVCRTIDQTLKHDPRCRDIQWFTGDEYNRQPRPRGESIP